MEEIKQYIEGRLNVITSEDDWEGQLCQICKEVQMKFGVSCEYKFCGGHESTGVDIECYAIAFASKEGEVTIIPFEISY